MRLLLFLFVITNTLNKQEYAITTKNTRLKFLKTNAAIWYNKIFKTKQLTTKFFSIKINSNNRQKEYRLHKETVVVYTVMINFK